ncbi:MAG: hypothetical protein ACLPWS_04170 [Rhodomicrobium sp.]
MSILQLALTAALSFLGVLIARWQLICANEKLRHDLYDRRFSVYMAYHELLVAIMEDDDVEAKHRKAVAAGAPSPFLLDSDIKAYLEELYKGAFRIHTNGPLVRNNVVGDTNNEWASKVDRHGQDKLKFGNRVEELAQNFERFLRLEDFARSNFFVPW